MKLKVPHLLIAICALQVPTFVYAHEQGNHSETGNDHGPNCAAMKGMDHSKMDMNDPVMQAMMQKCMSHDMDDHDMDGHSMDHMNSSDANKTEMQHQHKK